MNKAGIIDRIVADTGVTKTAATAAVHSIVKSISETLRKGGHVTISGFGSFDTYTRKSRNGRNPRTGALIKIAGRRVARFTPGVDLKKIVKKT